ncbi:hypothetical protein [Mycoplasmopsis edwardii]|nr:hypothetical protein [Mycoplasmopsis edwardii]
MKNARVYKLVNQDKENFLKEFNISEKQVQENNLFITDINLDENLFQVFTFIKNTINITISKLKKLNWETKNSKDFQYVDKTIKFEDKIKSLIEFEQFDDINDFVAKIMLVLLQNPRLIKSNKRFYLTFLLVLLKSLGYNFKLGGNFEKEFDLYYFFIALSNVDSNFILSDSFFSSERGDIDLSQLHKKVQERLHNNCSNISVKERHLQILSEIKEFLKEKMLIDFDQNYEPNKLLIERKIILPTETDIEKAFDSLINSIEWERIYNKLISLSKI